MSELEPVQKLQIVEQQIAALTAALDTVTTLTAQLSSQVGMSAPEVLANPVTSTAAKPATPPPLPKFAPKKKAAAPKAEPVEKGAVKGPTLDDVRDAYAAFVELNGQTEKKEAVKLAQAVIKGIAGDVANMTKIDPSDFPAIIEAFQGGE